ncbi:hypothetical protein A2U01_0055260, partial [Trifolium medium]|nr:hypothetical protein [Trifolium medium]
AVLEGNCRELDEKKLQYERMIHALRLEEAAAQAVSAGVVEAMTDDAGSEEEEADPEAGEEESDSSESASV